MSELKRSTFLSLWFKRVDSEEKALKIIKWGSLSFLFISFIFFIFSANFLYVLSFYGGFSLSKLLSFIFFIILLLGVSVISPFLLLSKIKSRSVAVIILLLLLPTGLNFITSPNYFFSTTDLNILSFVPFILWAILFFISIKLVEATFYYQKLKKSK